MSGLSLSDVAEVAGVVAVVVTALVAPVWSTSRKTQAAVAAMTEALARADRRADLHQAVGRSQLDGWTAALAAFEAESGLLHRTMVGRAHEVDATVGLTNLRATRVGIEKAAAEAALIYGDERRQRAALQLLVHQLGDMQTVALLKTAAALNNVGAVDASEIRKSLQVLSDRLGTLHA